MKKPLMIGIAAVLAIGILFTGCPTDGEDEGSNPPIYPEDIEDEDVYLSNGTPYNGSGTMTPSLLASPWGKISNGKLSFTLPASPGNLESITEMVKDPPPNFYSDSSVNATGFWNFRFIEANNSGFYDLSLEKQEGDEDYSVFFLYVDKPLTINGKYLDEEGLQVEWQNLNLQAGWNEIEGYTNNSSSEIYKIRGDTPGLKWTLEKSPGGDIRGTWKKEDNPNIVLTVTDDQLRLSGTSSGVDTYPLRDLDFLAVRYGNSYKTTFVMVDGKLIVEAGGIIPAGAWVKQN